METNRASRFVSAKQCRLTPASLDMLVLESDQRTLTIYAWDHGLSGFIDLNSGSQLSQMLSPSPKRVHCNTRARSRTLFQETLRIRAGWICW